MPLVGGVVKCDGDKCVVRDVKLNPSSFSDGGGSRGGGVEAREGIGDEARDDDSGLGDAGALGSGAAGGCSRRWIREEKNPEMRFDVRVCIQSVTIPNYLRIVTFNSHRA